MNDIEDQCGEQHAEISASQYEQHRSDKAKGVLYTNAACGSEGT